MKSGLTTEIIEHPEKAPTNDLDMFYSLQHAPILHGVFPRDLKTVPSTKTHMRAVSRAFKANIARYKNTRSNFQTISKSLSPQKFSPSSTENISVQNS